MTRYQEQTCQSNTWPNSPITAVQLANFRYPVYEFLNLGRGESYKHYNDPTDLPYMRDLKWIHRSLGVVGESALSLAHGSGKWPPTTLEVQGRNRYFGGRVLVSNVGQSVVPNYPLKNALVSGTRSMVNQGQYSIPGRYNLSLVFTDPYGAFNLRNQSADFPNFWRTGNEGGVTPIAVGFGQSGLIEYMKDEGEIGQRLYKSTRININARAKVKNITLVTFRAAPVTIIDLLNPQTMKDYTGVELIDYRGLTRFGKECLFQDEGIFTTWIEPDSRFYVKLMSGTPENELAKTTRSFMLGDVDNIQAKIRREIEGSGYLASDWPFLLRVPFEKARSMIFLNGKRLELENKHAMADERTNAYHQKSLELFDLSSREELSDHDKKLAARESATYSILNHPVLRKSIFEAVMGILWYLALLAPFVFFFEKLVFGFPDIRKQLAAQAIVFLIVFGLLRVLHPAFEMVRSSLMILLGFIIILISGGITILFAGKFQENLEDIRKKQGKVEAAEINKFGVMGSAFMLGLNNMHRRKVRTGLTCATLTLMTFVMICFTSVSSDLVDQIEAIGKAPFQGLLIKGEKFKPVSAAEVTALRSRYGDKYDVSERWMTVGIERAQERQRFNPDLELAYKKDGKERKTEADAIIQFRAAEPLRDQIRFLTEYRWFDEHQELDTDDLIPVLLPDAMADKLGLTVDDVNNGTPHVTINGTKFIVQGIFDSRAFAELRDLDGMDLLPFDIERMTIVQKELYWVLADDTAPRIPAENVILSVNRPLPIRIENSNGRVVSVAVSMPKAGYKEASSEIDRYLEQRAEGVFYGLDGVAYYGKRSRETSLGGLLDMLIPLIIAALTVLNTMKGSVYERRDEIFVYNAVGIAPRYVFFMFFAEAFVYAVVGSVLGYLLSQGTGRILTELNFTGGLNMTFTSLTTIYASLTIAAAVFVSTYFPARQGLAVAGAQGRRIVFRFAVHLHPARPRGDPGLFRALSERQRRRQFRHVLFGGAAAGNRRARPNGGRRLVYSPHRGDDLAQAVRPGRFSAHDDFPADRQGNTGIQSAHYDRPIDRHPRILAAAQPWIRRLDPAAFPALARCRRHGARRDVRRSEISVGKRAEPEDRSVWLEATRTTAKSRDIARCWKRPPNSRKDSDGRRWPAFSFAAWS